MNQPADVGGHPDVGVAALVTAKPGAMADSVEQAFGRDEGQDVAVGVLEVLYGRGVLTGPAAGDAVDLGVDLSSDQLEALLDQGLTVDGRAGVLAVLCFLGAGTEAPRPPL